MGKLQQKTKKPPKRYDGEIEKKGVRGRIVDEYCPSNRGGTRPQK